MCAVQRLRPKLLTVCVVPILWESGIGSMQLAAALVGGVSGMVIIDLKTKKVMNSFQGIVICCFDPHRATWGQLF